MSRNIEKKTTFIPFARPSLGQEEVEAVTEVLKSGWLTTGRVTEDFERAFAHRISADFALALNSATAGLHLALKTMEIPPGSYVVTTPFTFAASAEVVRYVQAHPLFADTESDSFNIDPACIEKAFAREGKKISAIIPVHVAGQLCRMDEILSIAEKYGVPVIEDAAHAFPVPTESGYAGTLGDIGVFSFYATKTITTGEGGMLVTRREDVAKKVKSLRLHGIDKVIWSRSQGSEATPWEYDVIDAGYKYNLTDIASAIGIEQLKKADQFLQKRKIIAAEYIDAFREYDFLKTPPAPNNHPWHLFILEIDEQKLKINRSQYIQNLMDRGVGLSVHFKPLHLMSYYKKMYGYSPGDFPNALAHYSACFSLPIYPEMTEEQIRYIINQVVSIGKENYIPSHGS